MSLTQEQIKKIAEDLSKVPNSTLEINKILDYFELLKEVDTDNIEPTYSVIEKENTLREDIETPKTVKAADLLACSPQKVVANQIAVSNIMK